DLRMSRSKRALYVLGRHADEFARRLREEFDRQIARLDATHRALIADLEARMLRLGELTMAAFDLRHNAELLLASSMRLAEAHGVPDARIMRSVADVDRYILG